MLAMLIAGATWTDGDRSCWLGSLIAVLGTFALVSRGKRIDLTISADRAGNHGWHGRALMMPLSGAAVQTLAPNVQVRR